MTPSELQSIRERIEKAYSHSEYGPFMEDLSALLDEVERLREALRLGVEQIGRCCYSPTQKNWHAKGCAVPIMKQALAARTDGRKP